MSGSVFPQGPNLLPVSSGFGSCEPIRLRERVHLVADFNLSSFNVFSNTSVAKFSENRLHNFVGVRL